MKRFLFFASLAIGCLAGVARATPIVTYTLAIDSNGPGTFSVFADDSVGDNAGLASYAVSLFNVSTITNASPNATYFDASFSNHSSAGFDLFRSSNGSALDATVDPVTGSEDTVGATGPTVIIYGYGQTADSFAAHNPFAGGFTVGVTQGTWAAHLLLITGTYDTAGPSPQFGPGPSTATVFVNNSSTDVTPANVQLLVPEPSFAGVCLIGLLAAFGRRRSHGRRAMGA